MRVVLDALREVGERANERAAVIDAAMRPRVRDSVIGGYTIDGGDVDTKRFAGYRRVGGALEYVEAREPGAGPGRGGEAQER
jgi:hypothetical protein